MRKSRGISVLGMALRLALIVACAWLGFFSYGLMRTRSGPIDRSAEQRLGYAILALVPAGVLTGLFVAPVAIIVRVQRMSDRPRNRLRDGRCPTCAYPLTGAPVCPECGEKPSPPARTEWQVTGATLLGLFLLIAAGTAVGSIAAELVILPDEAAFKREARAAGKAYWRPRHGPFSGELSCDQNGMWWCVDD